MLFPEVESQFLRRQQRERAPVQRRRSVEPDGIAVRLRGIALVVLPVVAGIAFSLLKHVFVAVSLGKYRRSSNGEILAVALHDSGMRQRRGGATDAVSQQRAVAAEAVAVDDDRLGTHAETVERTVHGED